MPAKIDVNRGVLMTKHPAGFAVYMYKQDPGTYYDAHGNEVPDQVAKAAGFDVPKYKRTHDLFTQRKLVEAKIAEQMGAVLHEVMKERAGFKLVHIGNDVYHVENPNGDRVTPVAVPEVVAIALMEELAPEGELIVLDLDNKSEITFDDEENDDDAEE